MYYQKMHLSLWSNEGEGFKLNRDQWSPIPSGLMTPDLSFFGEMGGIRVRRGGLSAAPIISDACCTCLQEQCYDLWMVRIGSARCAKK